MSEEQHIKLGTYVNLMYASTQLLIEPILGLQPKYVEEDFVFDHKEELRIIQNEEEVKKVDDYLQKCKQLLISLANLLYKIKLDDKDCTVLAKSIKGNKEFLKSMNIEKGDINASQIHRAIKYLERKYGSSDTFDAQETGDKNTLPFNMPIEDVFAIRGRGTVITGRIEAGRVSVNDKIYLFKEDVVLETTVKGIELYRKLLDQAECGDNVGLLIGDIKKSQIKKGMIASSSRPKKVD